MIRSIKNKQAEARAVSTAAQVQSGAESGDWELRRAGAVRILKAKRLEGLDWLAHGFSTRPGGASELEAVPNGSKTGRSPKVLNGVLNLGFTDWDSWERVEANRERFFGAVDAGGMRVVTLRQIHSDIVHSRGTSAAPGGEAPRADAAITREPGILLTVQTADCIPVLLADTKTRAVGAVHSGWRGTLRRIAEKTLGRMRMEFGTQPEDVIAAIGPGIGRCCYEVGPEVAKEFESQFFEAREWFDGPFDAAAGGENDPNWLPWLTMRPPGHPLPSPRVSLDLIAANRAILTNAGVPATQIFDSGYCTACRSDLFFSYRRERTTGRLMAAIGIR